MATPALIPQDAMTSPSTQATQAADALTLLRNIDEANLTHFYFTNIYHILQYDAPTLISILAGKGEWATQTLRTNLIIEIINYFPDYSSRTPHTRTNLEDICKDIHTLT